jgi:hypothetical protein
MSSRNVDFGMVAESSGDSGYSYIDPKTGVMECSSSLVLDPED